MYCSDLTQRFLMPMERVKVDTDAYTYTDGCNYIYHKRVGYLLSVV